MGVGYVTGFKRVAADKFCEVSGLVGFGHFPRPHLIKKDLYASFCSLPGCFRAREAASYYHEFWFHPEISVKIPPYPPFLKGGTTFPTLKRKETNFPL